MIIDNAGNVGLGTPTPQTQLELTGSLGSPYGGLGTYANLATYSEAFDNAAWVKTNATVTADAVTAPDGQTTAETAVPATAATTTLKQTSGTAAVANKAYTFSVWGQVASGTKALVLTVGDTATTNTATATLTTSWQRFSVTYTASATPSGNVFAQVGDATWTATTVRLWGAQLEQASAPGVYAKTTTDTVTATRGLVANTDAHVFGNLEVHGQVLQHGGTLGQTLTGTLTFSGVTTDITTGTNEHLALMPNGTGNVGIGTTSPGAALEVKAGADATIPAIIEGNSATQSANLLQIKKNAAATPLVVVDSAGQVGIGTASPPAGSLLTLNAGSGNYGIQMQNNGTGKAYLGLYPYGQGAGGITDDLLIRSDSSNILFDFAGFEKARITSAGNVGIGNTAPGTTLDVTGTGRFSSTLTASNGLTQTTGALNLTASSGSAALTLSSSTTAFNVNSGIFDIDTTNSRVGIGTAAPGIPLVVQGTPGTFQGSGGGMIGIQTPSTATDGVFYLAAGTTGGTLGELVVNGATTGRSVAFGSFTNDPLYIRTNNTNRVTVDTSGNVGIGETTPGAKLQINTGAAGTRGLIIKGAASQTVSLQQWQNSAGTVLARMDATGQLGLGVSPSVKLDVSGGNIRLRETGTATATAQYPSSNLLLRASAWDTNLAGGLGGASLNGFKLRAFGLSAAGPAYRLGIMNETGSELLSLRESGNVGLGTIAPSQLLHLARDGDVAVRYQVTSTNTSSGLNNPSAAVSDASNFGTVAWINPTNVFTSNDLRATAALSIGETSQYLKITGFGYAIPAGATILGIKVEVERSKTGTGEIVDSEVKIVKGGTIGVDDRSDFNLWPTVDTYQEYGGAADLWGETWTATDINSATFGVAIAAQEASFTDTATAQIDHVRVTIYHTAGTAVNWAMGAQRSAAGNFKLSASTALGTSDVITVIPAGPVGIGTTSPTAVLHLKAGTATANTAPLKLTAGTNLTTAEAGAVEWDGTNLFVTQTTGPTRKTLAYTDSALTGSGQFTTLSSTGVTTLGNNSATVAIDSSDWDITATGAITGVGPITSDGTLTFSGVATDITTGPNEHLALMPNGTGNVGIGTTSPASRLHVVPATAAAFQIDPFSASAGNTGEARFLELAANGTNYVGFKSPDALAANVIWTLPTADGTANQVLATNGSGALAWANGLTNALTSGNIFVGNSSNVAASVAMSGDVTMDNLGATTIGANKVTSAKILDGEIVNADVSATAAIAGTKVSPNFGSQAVATTGTLAAGATTISSTLGLSGTLTFSGVTTDITTGTNEHLALMPNGTGNVGIGTTSPSQKLAVVGDVSVRKGDKVLLDSDDATADTYVVRNAGATTVSWVVDGTEIATFKKQTEVR